jgi:hypothetical protein
VCNLKVGVQAAFYQMHTYIPAIPQVLNPEMNIHLAGATVLFLNVLSSGPISTKPTQDVVTAFYKFQYF